MSECAKTHLTFGFDICRFAIPQLVVCVAKDRQSNAGINWRKTMGLVESVQTRKPGGFEHAQSLFRAEQQDLFDDWRRQECEQFESADSTLKLLLSHSHTLLSKSIKKAERNL